MVPSGRRNQVKLVLDDEIRVGERAGQLSPAWFRCTVETVLVVTIGPTQEDTGSAHPRQGGEFVHRRNKESGQPAVQGLIHGDDRERTIADKVALEVRADDPHLLRMVRIGTQHERARLKCRIAPRTLLQRNGGGLALRVILELPDLGPGRIGAAVALPAQMIRRGGLSHPEPDFERPFSVPVRCILPLKLQSAHESCRSRQLVEG